MENCFGLKEVTMSDYDNLKISRKVNDIMENSFQCVIVRGTLKSIQEKYDQAITKCLLKEIKNDLWQLIVQCRVELAGNKTK